MKIVQMKQMPEIHIKNQSQYGFTGLNLFCRAAELALDGFFAALCKTSPPTRPEWRISAISASFAPVRDSFAALRIRCAVKERGGG